MKNCCDAVLPGPRADITPLSVFDKETRHLVRRSVGGNRPTQEIIRFLFYFPSYKDIVFFFEQHFFLPVGFPENFPAKIYLPNFQNTVLGKIPPEYPMLLF